MNEYKIKISDYINGKNTISGRNTGNKIKNDFVKYYEMGININLDFIGINNATHSFIDELIGAFIFYDGELALKRLKFTNCNGNLKSIIKFVIVDRFNKEKQI